MSLAGPPGLFPHSCYRLRHLHSPSCTCHGHLVMGPAECPFSQLPGTCCCWACGSEPNTLCHLVERDMEPSAQSQEPTGGHTHSRGVGDGGRGWQALQEEEQLRRRREEH